MAKKLEAPGGAVQRWWDRLSGLPGGKAVFSMVIGRTAPYTGTIGARVEELRPGYARWSMADRRGLRNHLASIHAVALVNLGEVTSGTAMLMSLPAGTRGIVTALQASYHRKARGRLTAECNCVLPEITSDVRLDVVAEIRNSSGELVTTVTVTWLLSPVQ